MPRTPIHEFLNQLRRYDGSTNANQFMSRFRGDLVSNGYNAAWAIQNIDRILDGDAKSWFASKWPLYSSRYELCADNDAYGILLDQIETDLVSMFDHSSQVATWRAQNKALKFNMGDDAQKYVTKKMEILTHIDSEMSEARKVNELVRGLPYNIQVPMVLQNMTTCDEFLRKLRKLSETHYLSAALNSRSRSNSSFRDSTVTMAKLDDGPNQSQNRSAQFRTPNGKPICFHCNKVGHVKKVCRNLNNPNYSAAQNNNRSFGRNNNQNPSRQYNNGYQSRNTRNFQSKGYKGRNYQNRYDQNQNINALNEVENKHVENNDEQQSMPIFHSCLASSSNQNQGN